MNASTTTTKWPSTSTAGRAAAVGLFAGNAAAQDAQPNVKQRSFSTSIARNVEERNSINNFFRNDGRGNYTPIKGNSVLVKNAQHVGVKDDFNSSVYLSGYNSNNTQIKNTKSEGTGLTEDEAIKDALSNAGSYINGHAVKAQTTVKNDDLTQNDIGTRGEVVIHSFKILKSNNNNGIYTVNLFVQLEQSTISIQGQIPNRQNLRGPESVFSKDIFNTGKTGVTFNQHW